MKRILTFTLATLAFGSQAQIVTPQPSPAASLTQTVGITEIQIDYSRPAKRDRVIFGDLVPFDQLWRTGANKNTMIKTDDVLVFGKDTLQAGTYAIYSKPGKSSWEIYFYTDTENWGNPESWDEAKIALTAKAEAINKSETVESFTIQIENVEEDGAILSFTWDRTDVNVPFKVLTKERVMANIEKVMNGPSANDYYRAADYYLTEKKELDKALVWINKSLDMQKEKPFWILRRKALIQAELGDYKGAIETAKASLEGAKAANYDNYVKMNEESIKEWTPKAK